MSAAIGLSSLHLEATTQVGTVHAHLLDPFLSQSPNTLPSSSTAFPFSTISSLHQSVSLASPVTCAGQHFVEDVIQDSFYKCVPAIRPDCMIYAVSGQFGLTQAHASVCAGQGQGYAPCAVFWR